MVITVGVVVGTVDVAQQLPPHRMQGIWLQVPPTI